MSDDLGGRLEALEARLAGINSDPPELQAKIAAIKADYPQFTGGDCMLMPGSAGGTGGEDGQILFCDATGALRGAFNLETLAFDLKIDPAKIEMYERIRSLRKGDEK